MCVSLNGPSKASRVSLPVMRIRPGAAVLVTIMCDRGVWLASHWHRRSVPCCVDACPLCDFLPVRDLGYYVVRVEGRGGRLALLEVPYGFSFQLGIWTEHSPGDSMRGMQMELSRAKKRSPLEALYEGRVSVDMSSEAATRLLFGAVATLMRLPAPAADADLDAWGDSTVQAARVQCQMVYDELDGGV